MKLGGDYYDDLAWELDDEHVTHCVDSIRQSLMYVLSFSPSCPGGVSLTRAFVAVGAPQILPSTFGNGVTTSTHLLVIAHRLISAETLRRYNIGQRSME